MNRLFFGFSILSFFSLGACVQMANSEPFCELTPPIMTVEKQQNSEWCWAASTTLVINHLDPQRALKQCTVVQNTIAAGREDIDCCLATKDVENSVDRSNPKVIASINLCQTTNDPENALEVNRYKFDRIKYFPLGPDPYNQGLDWADLTAQICSNRPIISLYWLKGGGGHVVVITGFKQNPDAYVDVDDNQSDGFYNISFQDFRGIPGERKHVRDLINIRSSR